MRTTHRPRTVPFLALLAALVGLASTPVLAQTPPCEVTTINDSGAGSFRETIDRFNLSLCSGTTITFNIPVPGLVQLLTPLPPFIRPVIINGYSQPGSSPSGDPNTLQTSVKVGIDGTAAATAAALSPPFCGLAFPTTTASELKGFVVKNFATTLPGPPAFPAGRGVCGMVNVTGSVIVNNGIGIDSNDGFVGGTGGGDGNYIADNNISGISFGGGPINVIRNIVTKNTIGLEAICGTGGLIQNNQFIKGGGDAIILDGRNITITGNSIGVDGTGAEARNAGTGLRIGNFECGSRNNVVSLNNILHNGIYGVYLQSNSTFGIAIRFNSIYANVSKNIHLQPDTPPPGPNNLQKAPVIGSVAHSGTDTVVTFTLDSTPSSTFTVSAFQNPAPGIPAGALYAGQTTVSTPASGPATGTLVLTGLRDHISLTAENNATGDTSEFSAMMSVPPTANVTLSSTSMDFNNVDVGTTSPEKTISLLSSGGAAYRITAINSDSTCTGPPACASGDFLCATTCKPSTDYAPGTSCVISGKFSPKSPGFTTATIYICDNTATSPRSITLTGNGVTPPPVEISPSTYDYGRVLVGRRSESTFMIINHATIPATLGQVAVDNANFAVTSTTCGATLAPVSACYASVAFLPNQPGAATTLLEVPVAFGPSTALGKAVLTDGLPPARAKAQLQGMGFQSAELALPAIIEFGSFTLGSPSPLVQTLKLTNTGNAVLTFASVSATEPFTLINECPLNLNVGQSCTLKLEFRTTTVGDFEGILNVVTNATDGTRAIRLVAQSQVTPHPVIRVTPHSIGFGSQMIGSVSPVQRVTVKNEGGAPATLGTLATSPDFVMTTTCGPTLDPGLTCFADVAMRPIGFGQRSGQLAVPSNAEGSPHVVNMVGLGCRPFTFGSNRGGGGGCSP